MKNSFMKKLAAALGFLAMVFVFTAIPGTKADAATLKNGVVGPIAATDIGETHKFTMPKDGYVSMQVLSDYNQISSGAYNSTCYVTVYRGNKAVSKKMYHNIFSKYSEQQILFFALKKGTYKVKVEMSYKTVSYTDANGQYMSSVPNQYKVGTVVKYAPDQGGTKKSKATTIKLKQAKQGIVGLADAASSYKGSKGDWYKFKLKKKTKVKLYVKCLSTNRYGDRQTLRYTVSGKASYKQINDLAQGKSVKLPKGTYYVKIYKDNKLDSGYYKIGLNKAVK